ncbi:MAG TPA: branched-chain amino acid ABC transporter permease [Syntrophomonadaceae bacterium]|nr:branched-chain amino acid ABC transporter permease [Syntrophomonadaceae bacterium]
MESFKNSRIKNIILPVVGVAALYMIVQFLISSELLNPYYQIILFLIGINIILAVSLNLINGITGQFSIGHAGFMSVGAYMGAVCTVKLGYPFVVAIIAAFLVAGIMGLFIGVPTLRLRGDYLAIATLGFGEIVRVVLLNIDYVGGAAGIIGIPQLTNWAWLFGSVVITIVVIQNFIRSSHGRACIAIREDELAAELMGVNTTLYKVLAFSIGAAFAGLAGALYAHYFFLIQPTNFNFLKSFDILVMVVLGGMGSTSGCVLAAIFLTIISALLQSFTEVRMILYALVLIIVMIRRPQGLMGNKELSLNLLGKFRRRDKHAAVRDKVTE